MERGVIEYSFLSRSLTAILEFSMQFELHRIIVLELFCVSTKLAA